MIYASSRYRRQGLHAFSDHRLAYTLIALGTVLGVVVLSTLGGYGFARYELPRRNVLFIVILSTLMIPFQAILTPLFLVLARVNLTNSLIGLTLVYITFQLPFALFLMHHHLPAAAALLREGGWPQARSSSHEGAQAAPAVARGAHRDGSPAEEGPRVLVLHR
jgi:ABC-type maltose transport system permease subunit